MSLIPSSGMFNVQQPVIMQPTLPVTTAVSDPSGSSLLGLTPGNTGLISTTTPGASLIGMTPAPAIDATTSGLGSLSSSLGTIFQRTFSNSLASTNTLSTGGGSLVSSALQKAVPGSNPIDPFAGVSALTGLGSFIDGIQAKAAQTAIKKKQDAAAALAGGGAAGGAAGLGGLLQTLMSSLGGGAAGGAANPLSALLGGASTPNPATSSALSGLLGGAPAADQTAADISAPAVDGLGANATQTKALLQLILSKLQTMVPLAAGGVSLGGGQQFIQQPNVQRLNFAAAPQSGVPAQIANFTGQVVPQANPALAGQTQALATAPVAATPGAVPNAAATAAAISTPTSAGGQLFTTNVNFTAIDSAISDAMDGITNTLPLVNL